MSDGEHGTKCNFCDREYDDMGNDLAMVLGSEDGFADWCGQCSLQGKFHYPHEKFAKIVLALLNDIEKYMMERKPEAAQLRVIWTQNEVRLFASAQGMVLS